jgi:glycosyltransferase involved in cell wall biosynthesis
LTAKVETPLSMNCFKVLHVLPDFCIGGAERMAMHMVMNCDRTQFEVAAVSLYARRGTDIENKLDAAGVQVWYLGKRGGIDVSMLPRLRAVVSEFQPQIVHTHRYVLRYVLPVCESRSDVRLVHTVHNVAEKEVDAIGRVVHRLGFRFGRVTPVCIARDVAESVSRVYGVTNAPLIANGIPTAEYADGKARDNVRRSLGLKDDEMVLLGVGRLMPQKNHGLLIRAFALASKKCAVPLRCLIAGTGELEPKLRAAAADLGIGDRIQFLGNRQDIPDLLNAVDVFALSSDWEGNPLSLMEAMSAGKAAICTAVGGVPEMIETGESGLLVPPGNIEEFADAMALLATNSELRMRLGRQAARVAAQRFGVRAMVEAYERLYLQLLRPIYQPKLRT